MPIGDIEVGRIGFGAMRLCGKGAWGWPSDKARAVKVLHALQAEGLLIDTADTYGPETSEYLLGDILHPYEGVTIATKGGMVRGGPRDWTTDGRPEHLIRACENSLRRLRLDTIDLYQLHAIDDDVPLEDSVGALVRLQQQGKIRHIGISNVTTDELERARAIAEVASVQNRYNLADRGHEAVLKTCEEAGITFLAYYPLATGKLTRDERLMAIAQKHRAKPGQIALAWLLQHSPALLPIPGTHSVAHLQQNMAAQRISLDEEDTTALDRIGSAS